MLEGVRGGTKESFWLTQQPLPCPHNFDSTTCIWILTNTFHKSHKSRQHLVNHPIRWSLLFIFGFLYWSYFLSQIQRNIVLCYARTNHMWGKLSIYSFHLVLTNTNVPDSRQHGARHLQWISNGLRGEYLSIQFVQTQPSVGGSIDYVLTGYWTNKRLSEQQEGRWWASHANQPLGGRTLDFFRPSTSWRSSNPPQARVLLQVRVPRLHPPPETSLLGSTLPSACNVAWAWLDNNPLCCCRKYPINGDLDD